MKKTICMVTLLLLALNAYAGFETPEDQKNKRLAERAVETKNYINSIVGKTAWYNSVGCATKPIYANKEQMSYRDAVYTTDNKYVPVKFLEADIYQDTYQDYITFKLQIDNKEEGYIKTSSLSKIEISDKSWECFKTEKPKDKTTDRPLSETTNDILFGWDTSCRKDAFNGKKICSISRDRLMVLYIDGRYAVSVGRNHYPGTESAIKIDDNVHYSGKEGLINPMYANLIVKQMKEGKKAVIRYREWPYDYNKDSEVDLTGFTKKLNEMLDWYKKL